MDSNKRRLRVLLLAVGTVLWFGIGGELLARFEDDWRIDVLKLETRRASAAEPPPVVPVSDVTYLKGVDPAWFSAAPARIDKPANPESRPARPQTRLRCSRKTMFGTVPCWLIRMHVRWP